MRISVRVKPNAKEARVEKLGDCLVVYVKESPHEGKANKTAIKLLADYLDVPKSHVALVLGQTSKQKVFEIKK